MTPAATSRSTPDAGPPPGRRPEPPGRGWLIVLVLAVLATVLAGAAYWWGGALLSGLPAPSSSAPTSPSEEEDVVRVVGPGLIRVAAGSRLAAKIVTDPVRRETISAPLLTVTGSVVARLGDRTRTSAAPGAGESHWDFATPELASTYGDWVKARADLDFTREQAVKIRRLTETTVEYLTAVAKRKKKLAEIGTEADETRAAAEADRLKADIQGQKDIFEAETNVRNAVRTRDLLERQLLQAGIDPDVLTQSKDNVVLIVADVPEARAPAVRVGQACVARFFALPDTPFPGLVGRIGPSLSKERRTLRVIFRLRDPKGELLPGMFADIGLGTESRTVLTVPTEAVFHSGRSDYLLVRVGAGEYRVVEVRLGEPHGQRVTILSGLRPGDEVVGAGAILLKPPAVQALHKQT